jgi:hypothetical protein
MTNKTRQTRGRHSFLTGRQTEHLLYGFCLPFDPAEYGHRDIKFPFRDEAHRRQCWQENREYIMSLEGIERVPGVFGHTPLRKGKKPAAMLDYDKKRSTKNEQN